MWRMPVIPLGHVRRGARSRLRWYAFFNIILLFMLLLRVCASVRGCGSKEWLLVLLCTVLPGAVPCLTFWGFSHTYLEETSMEPRQALRIPNPFHPVHTLKYQSRSPQSPSTNETTPTDDKWRYQASYKRPHLPQFKALAVSTDISPPASPCGMCR
jgi:hypothetical protein